MDATEKAHIDKAIEQLQIFLLSGLIAQTSDITFTPAFIDTTSRLISNVMTELSQLSMETKEKMTEIRWCEVELFKNPDEIRSACLQNPAKMTVVIRKNAPQLLELLKKYSENSQLF